MSTTRTRTRTSAPARKAAQQEERPVDAVATPAAEVAAVDAAVPAEETIERPAAEPPAEQAPAEQSEPVLSARAVVPPAGARGFDLAAPVTFAGIEWTPADADPFASPIGAALAAEMAGAA